MPRVPQYPIGGVQPSSGNPVFIDNGPADAIARAGYGLAGAINEVGQRRQVEQNRINAEVQRQAADSYEREQKMNIQRAKNDLYDYQFNSEQAYEADPNNTGYGAKGHYGRVSQANNEYISSLAEKYNIDPQHADVAMLDFMQASRSYLNNASHWEASNMQTARMDTFRDAVNIANTRASNDVKYGGWDVIDSSVNDIVSAGQTLGAKSDKVDKIVSASVNTAFLAWSDDNPVAALEALKDKRADKYLPADVKRTLEQSIEKKRVPYLRGLAVADISQVPGYENQRELADKIDDPEVKAGVLKDLASMETERKKQADLAAQEVVGKFMQVFDNPASRLPSESALYKQATDALPGDENAKYVHQIMRLRDAAESERKHDMESGKPKMSERDKVAWRGAVQSYVLTQGYTNPLQAAADKNIPDDLVMEAAKFAEDNGKDPSFSEYLTQAKRDNYDLFYGKPDMEGRYIGRMTDWYRKFKKENGKPPTDSDFQNASKQFLANSAQEIITPRENTFENIKAIHPEATQIRMKDGKVVAMYPGLGGTYVMQDGSGRKMTISAEDYWDTLRSAAFGGDVTKRAK